MNAIKHHHPAIFKDAFGSAKIGNVNGVNVIGLALQGPSVPGLQLVNSGSGRPPSNLDIGYTYQHPLQARGPTLHDVEPSLPLLAGARALMGPHATPPGAAAAAAAAATVTSLPPLQPRSATTGGTDLLFPLQPRLLPALLPATVTEQQEATPETSSTQEKKRDKSEEVVAQERF
jgi:hypothetical protein